MAALNFPTPSTVGELFTQNGKTWRWDGVSWKSYNTIGITGGGTGLTSINSGNAFLSSNSAGTALTYREFSAGSGITFSITPSTVTFSTLSQGNVTGVGTSSYVPIWTSGGTALTNSIMYQSGAMIQVAGHIKASTKSFIIPHPLDPDNYWLEHGSLEGPEHGVYIRGRASGINYCEINFPDYWKALVEGEPTIIITSRCKYHLFIEFQSQEKFIVRRSGPFLFSKKNIEFDYFVVGDRIDQKLKLKYPRD